MKEQTHVLLGRLCQQLTPFGKTSIIVFLLALTIGIPSYQFIMNPYRIMKRAFSSMSIEKLHKAIERGADVNAFIDDLRPIVLAFEKGRTDFMEVLAGAGANVNISDTNNVSFAGQVAQKGDSTALRILGEHDADFHAKADFFGCNVLTHILSQKKYHLLPIAMQYTERNRMDYNGGRTPLHYADFIDSKTLAYLVADGENPNARDSTGNTPLHTVTQVDAAYNLHQIGADINAVNNCSVPAIFYQVGNGHGRVYQYLISNGASTNLIDDYGQTILTYAMMTENELLHRQVAANYCESYPEQCATARKKLQSTGIKALATLVYTHTAHRAIMSRLATSQAAKSAVKRGLLKGGLLKLGFRAIPFIGWASTIYDAAKLAEVLAEQDKQIKAHKAEAERLAAERKEAQVLLRKEFLHCNSYQESSM